MYRPSIHSCGDRSRIIGWSDYFFTSHPGSSRSTHPTSDRRRDRQWELLPELQKGRGSQTNEEYNPEDDALSFYSICNVENWSPFNDCPSDILIAISTEGILI